MKPTGDDGADGKSPATAWKTIQKGADALQPGDTLILGAGEYRQQVNIARSGTEQAPITIRAAIPGFAVLRGSVLVQGFSKVAGTRFVYAAKCDQPVYRLLELDTRSFVFGAPALADLDQFRNSFLYDEARQTLYIHSSDGDSPDRHVYEAYVRPGYGMTVGGSHVNLEGLVIRGFCPAKIKEAGRGFGLQIGAQHVTVRNCTFLYNGGGITLNAQHCVIRDSLFIGNVEIGYGELAQIYNTSRCDDNQCLNNIVLDGQTHGIRFYNGAANGTAIGNIIKNNRIGLYYKASGGRRVAQRNVVADCSYFNWHTGTNPGPMDENFNTFQRPSEWHAANQPQPGANTLVFGRKEDPDPRFADPDHLDYRLQADSPYRGKGLQGADLGAYPYQPVVFYVAPDGDDANDGLSAARAFRTPARAMQTAKAGITIYFLPGTYEGTLRPASGGAAGQPVLIRGWGRTPLVKIRAPAGAPALDLTDLSHVTVEDVMLHGATSGVVLANCAGNKLERCLIADASQAGALLTNTKDCWLRRLTVLNSGGPAVELRGNCRGVKVTSSILNSAKGPALIAPSPDVIYTDYNDYLPMAGQPLALLGGKPAADLAALATLTGTDGGSISQPPRFTDATVAPTLQPDSAGVCAGEFGFNIGAGERQRRTGAPVIAEIEVRQLTPTTASLTWWTPNTSSASWRSPQGWWKGHPIISETHYGATPECLNVAPSWGDLCHRVTLKNLKPGATYYYRLAIPIQPYLWAEDPLDPGPEIPADAKANWPCFWTEVKTFATPAEKDWSPSDKTYYVAPNGNPSNDGLKADQPATLTAVSDRVRAGDTVVMLDGEYRETFIPSATGRPGHPITLKAEKPGAVILDGSVFQRPCGVALFGVDHIVIDGLIFRRFADKGLASRAGFMHGQMIMFDAHDVTIRNCVFAGWGHYQEAWTARRCGDITMTNCVLTGLEAGVHGRDLGNVNLIGNTWYVPMIANIGMDTFRPGCKLTIKNNLFHGQEMQKLGAVGMIGVTLSGTLKLEDAAWCRMDYNAWSWGDGPAKKKRPAYIGMDGEAPKAGEPGGLKRFQERTGQEKHSLEPAADQVKFAGAPADFTDEAAFSKAFGQPVARGELIPTLSLFDLPADSPLNHAGENGAPIGARPVR